MDILIILGNMADLLFFMIFNQIEEMDFIVWEVGEFSIKCCTFACSWVTMTQNHMTSAYRGAFIFLKPPPPTNKQTENPHEKLTDMVCNKLEAPPCCSDTSRSETWRSSPSNSNNQGGDHRLQLRSLFCDRTFPVPATVLCPVVAWQRTMWPHNRRVCVCVFSP